MTAIKQDQVTALLVDDNAFSREVAARILKTAGVDLIGETANARTALEILRDPAREVDIVFCDLVMPDMDGIQFIRHTASLPRKPAFVLITGADPALLTTAEAVAHARGLRVLATIQKPMNLDATRQALSRFGGVAPQHHQVTASDIPIRDFIVALAKNQFILDYQPKVNLSDNTVVGFESLVRWQHPDRGLIAPAASISAAEVGGQIGPLTDYVTALALRQYATWAKTGLATKISINLSAHMLVDLDLPDRMAAEADRFAIDPQHVILEVTETGLLQDSANTLDILARLHMKGFPLSIDDFGTGYSSLEQLRRFPFSEMKIDRAFVHRANESAKARTILKSSANLGRSLGLSVVAEGAETQEDLETLREIGVDIVQGYVIARPITATQVPQWYNSWTSSRDTMSEGVTA